MDPTINAGNKVLINRAAYTFGGVKRGDLIAYRNTEATDSSVHVKRVIGLPGETVQIKDNLVYINGKPLDADDALGQATIAGIAEFPIDLGVDEYFLLGDNRESSEDSRFSGIGTIKREQLTGKVWFKFQPIEEFGLIQ